MKKRIKWILLSLFVLLNCLTILPNKVFADPYEGFGLYEIKGVTNPNQISDQIKYFYLHENPGQNDKIQIQLINKDTSAQNMYIKVVNANTNENGNIDYTGDLKDDPSLKLKMTDILKPTQNVVNVPARSVKTTTLNIKMPNSPYNGVILGGVVVSNFNKSIKVKSSNHINMINTCNYTMGVALTNSHQVDINQDKSVTLESVKAILNNYRKVIQAKILNPNPYIFNGAKVEANIKDSNGKKIFSKTQNNVNIAPYSAFPLTFDYMRKPVKSGRYLFTGYVITSKKIWKFERWFTITNNQAVKLNKKSPFKVQIPRWITISLLLSALIAIISTIYGYIDRYVLKNNFEVIKNEKKDN